MAENDDGTTPLSDALDAWWHDDHFGDDCDSDGQHSEACVETAFSDGYRAGQKDAIAAADRDRQFAEAVRAMLDVLGPQQMTINVERLHIIHRDIYGRPCTAATPDEKEG